MIEIDQNTIEIEIHLNEVVRGRKPHVARVKVSPSDIISIYREGGERAEGYAKYYARIKSLVDVSENSNAKAVVIYTYNISECEFNDLWQYRLAKKSYKEKQINEINEIKIVNITDQMEL